MLRAMMRQSRSFMWKQAAGLVKSDWKYEGDRWIWDFSVPEGAEASVTVPGETAAKIYAPGTYRIERRQLP